MGENWAFGDCALQGAAEMQLVHYPLDCKGDKMIPIQLSAGGRPIFTLTAS